MVYPWNTQCSGDNKQGVLEEYFTSSSLASFTSVAPKPSLLTTRLNVSACICPCNLSSSALTWDWLSRLSECWWKRPRVHACRRRHQSLVSAGHPLVILQSFPSLLWKPGALLGAQRKSEGEQSVLAQTE